MKLLYVICRKSIINRARHALADMPPLVRLTTDDGASFRCVRQAYARILTAYERLSPTDPAAAILANGITRVECWRQLGGRVGDASLLTEYVKLRAFLQQLEKDLSRLVWSPPLSGLVTA